MKVLVLTGMYPTPRDPAFGCFVAEQVEAVRRAGPDIVCDVLFFDGRASRANYARAALELRRRLRSGVHDLVHAHYGLAGLVAAAQRRAPVVLTLHGSDLHVPWQRAITRFAARRAHTVIVVSEAMKRMIRDVSAREVQVIPCGVDLERFRPMPTAPARARLGWRGTAPRVLFPGDPARRVKGHDLYREVLRRLREAGQPVVEVALTGIPREEVPVVMNACDLMLMTSRSEGSPMAVKEAMACCLPIVSVDVGDVADLVEGCDGCAVVPRGPGAAARLARAAVTSLQRGGRVDGRGRIAGLSQPGIAARILDIYRRAVGETREARGGSAVCGGARPAAS